MEGKYQHERNENLDEYLKDIGAPYLQRKMMSSRPILEVKQEGDKWTIKTISLSSTVVLTFTLGEEFTESIYSGATAKSVAKIEDNSIVISSTGLNNDLNIERIYEFKDDEVILTMTHEQSGVVAKRYFKKIP